MRTAHPAGNVRAPCVLQHADLHPHHHPKHPHVLAGSQVLASVGVQRDYWGGLSLPEWRPSGAQALLEPSALASQKQQLATDTVATAGWRQLEKAAVSAAADGEGEDEQEGLLEGGAVSGGWLWPVAATEPSVLAHHLAHPPQHPPELPAHSAAAAAGAHALRGAGVLASGGKGGAGPGGRPLTQALLQSIAGAGGPGALASLVRLDLGLEQLGSLEGLDAWCPNLQVLVCVQDMGAVFCLLLSDAGGFGSALIIKYTRASHH